MTLSMEPDEALRAVAAFRIATRAVQFDGVLVVPQMHNGSTATLIEFIQTLGAVPGSIEGQCDVLADAFGMAVYDAIVADQVDGSVDVDDREFASRQRPRRPGSVAV